MSVNKAILLGHLGQDPTTRYMTNGEAVTNVSLATSETWKDKSGEKQEKTEWHNLVFYRKLAEIAGEYLKKGSLVYIEGKITTEKYTDKQGVEKYATKIIVNEMKMLGGKPGGQDEAPQARPAAKTAPAAKSDFSDFDSSIPF